MIHEKEGGQRGTNGSGERDNIWQLFGGLAGLLGKRGTGDLHVVGRSLDPRTSFLFCFLLFVIETV